MKRREFIKNTGLAVAATLTPRFALSSNLNTIHKTSGDTLYNGIILPNIWPPRDISMNYEPMPLPYLDKRLTVVPIDIGRQLFVDDFLIEKTNLSRKSYQPKKMDFNPIFKPETALEMGVNGNPGASPKDGGVWWDPKDGLFKMWYEAGWLHTMAYATSKDGINWERPDLDIEPKTNRIVPEIVADSSTVWLDHFTDNPNERFKMFLRSPNSIPGSTERFNYGFCMVSPDGIHWSKPVKTGPCGDRSTIFYNPFRKKWIYSLRNTGNINKIPIGRHRMYHEHSDFIKGAQWSKEDMLFWTGADFLDEPDPYIGDKAQLYNLSAVGYESIMLGLHQIHLGPSNEKCRDTGAPKITELKVSYSRDGFHWHRPERGAFIPAERKENVWDRGYVQSVGGICNIVGNQLWFYYIGFQGNSRRLNSVYDNNGMHYNGSTGLAVLRRDGFVSLSAGETEGYILTRPVLFSGNRLFVNINCPKGQFRAELLDKDGAVIPGFSANECKVLSIDSTIVQVRWKNGKNILQTNGNPVRFRFYLTNGEFYSFWVSKDSTGASSGFNAAGGPGFTGGIDSVGKKAYDNAKLFPNLLKQTKY